MSVESYEVSPGVFKARQENALKADEREVCAGNPSTSQRKFSVSKAICFVASGQSSERRGKRVLPSKWEGPSCQTLVGKSSLLVELLPGHEKTDGRYSLVNWNSLLLPLVNDLHVFRRFCVSSRNQLLCYCTWKYLIYII